MKTRLNIGIFFLFLVFCGELNAAGIRAAGKYYSNNGIDKYINGKIASIELNSWNSNQNETKEEIKIEYYNNGLFMVTDNYKINFVYNEYFNEKIPSDFKLNENTTMLTIDLDAEYEIFFNLNSIIIEASKKDFKYRLELQFDGETKRLSKRINEHFSKDIFSDNLLLMDHLNFCLEYEYNTLGKLEYVYRIYNNERILSKSIYYDGKYRTIPRPFFHDRNEIPSPITYTYKEMLIYENDKMKYYVRVYEPEGNYLPSDIVEKEEARFLLLTIKYDENGNEILHTLFREENEYFEEYTQIYIIENKDYDLNNNWIKQNVYWQKSQDDLKLIDTYTRIINYTLSP